MKGSWVLPCPVLPSVRSMGQGIVLVVAICLVWTVPASAQTGGPYDLHWNVIAGGGGTMTGGSYSLSGSIGQPATAVSAGGAFTVTGGFWVFPTPIPGDIDGDGHVDVIDLLWLLGAFGYSVGNPNYLPQCDLYPTSPDGSVDVLDLLALIDTFGKY